MDNYEKYSDRELLIRIDERQRHIHSDLEKYNTKVDVLETKVRELDKDKVSRKTLKWIVTLAGGVVGGIISAIVVFIQGAPKQ